MRLQFSLVFGAHLLLTGFMVFSRRLSPNGILEWYLLALLPSLTLATIGHLVRRKPSYAATIRRELIKSLAILAAFFGLAVYLTRPRYIPRHHAIADLDHLIEKLESIHPDLYHRIPKDSYAAILADYRTRLPQRISTFDFYRDCSRLSALFQDGHTRPTPTPPIWMQLPFRAGFPYQIRIIDDRIYVVQNFDLLGRIPVGSEILSINGRAPSEFILEVGRLNSYENTGWRDKLIADPVNIAVWNRFGDYAIRYRRYPDGQVRQTHASGGPISWLVSAIRAKWRRPAELTYRTLPGKIGYLGFYGCNDLKGYRKFFESTFRRVKEEHVSHLIIDVRQNTGGHSVIGVELMQYLSHRPFKELDSVAFRVSPDLAATGKIDGYLRRKEQVAGTVHSRVIDGYHQPRENPLRFSGKSYLLADNGTFSAGAMFAAAYRSFGDGLVIGEETGGVTTGFGNVHFFRLPHSQLEMMVSWNEFVYVGSGTGDRRGVVPNHTVVNSIADDVQQTDRALTYTIDLIRSDQTRR